jgi:hypothetical protein
MSPSTRGRVFASCTAIPFWCVTMAIVWFGSMLPLRERIVLTACATLVCWGGWFGVMRLTAAMRIQERREKGLCLVCGYDLRATAERCPECATPRGVTPAMRRDMSIRRLAQRVRRAWNRLNGY